MATYPINSSLAQIESDPLRNFKYQIKILSPDLFGSGQSGNVKMGFMSASGMGITTEIIPYREGGDNSTALPLDSPVLTVNGWKTMGDIEIGDRVIDPYGQESKVVDILPTVPKDVYKVTMQDGSEATACWGHLWEVQTRNTCNQWKTEVLSTLEMKKIVGKKGYKVLLPKMVPFVYDVGPELPIDPYLLGILLAEGSLSDATLTFATADPEILARVGAALPRGLSVASSGGPKYRITSGNHGAGPRNINGRNPLITYLRELDLWGKRAESKYIPEVYLRASVADRTELLRGLMDGDGTIDQNGSASFTSTSEALARNVRELVFSLGGRASFKTLTNRTYVYKGERREARDAYLVTLLGMNINPFFLPRKASRFQYFSKSDSYARRVKSVEFVGREDVRCIEVSADSHLFVSHDCVPSHNTRKMPGQSDFAPLSLSSGVITGQGQMWTWMKYLFSVVQGSGKQVPGHEFRYNVQMDILEHPVTANVNVPVKASFKFFRAWPTSISFSDLDAGSNAVFVQQLVLAHEGFEYQLAGTGIGDTAGNW